ncbi:hypothetical protein KBP30_03220 [Streptomyces sp. Go40/10]|uniref:hypothetical protein n=1 Tax=Streptomyces sp. Go40/10 TaxID=2825844 RepID=UPI001E2B5996|nr:hypothetical protein [Streptomyces sp. Go40/10]UFR00249.1 hypothetical protein KBP30_03220 [Streptomyces sp. Go40/10]
MLSRTVRVAAISSPRCGTGSPRPSTRAGSVAAIVSCATDGDEHPHPVPVRYALDTADDLHGPHALQLAFSEGGGISLDSRTGAAGERTAAEDVGRLAGRAGAGFPSAALRVPVHSGASDHGEA